MEFNVLPHAKLLSPSNRSASGAAVKSDNKANQTTTQTVNVILPNSNQTDEPSVSIREIGPQPVVENNSRNEVASPMGQVEQQTNVQDPIATINFLKLVLESYMNNPIKYNGLIICTVSVLKQLIEVLTGCDECNIECDDLETKCCGSGKIFIQPINKIWCRNGDNNEIFKYKYSHLLQIFESYHISLKFVWFE